MSGRGIIIREILNKEIHPIYKRYQNRDTSYYMLLAFYGQMIKLLDEKDTEGLNEMYNNISNVLATYARACEISFDKQAYDHTGTLLDKPWTKLPPLRMLATILNMVLTCGLYKKEDILKVMSHHINLGYMLGIYDNKQEAV